MGANQSNGSSASIRLPDNENEQSDLLNNSLDQIDEPDEVVISGTSEQNEIEKLEAQLVELSSQHDDHSTELQNLMDEDILQEYIFDYSFNGIKATHLIVILDALFLFIRLVFMADVFVILALFELISLILMVVGYKREQHFFFWPFVLGCYFEMIVAVFQVAAICWVTLMHREPEWLAEGFDIVLFPVLAEQLNTSFGIFKIFFYVMWKLIVFMALNCYIVYILVKVVMKKHDVAKERKCLAEIESQKIAIDRQLELLRANKSNRPIDS